MSRSSKEADLGCVVPTHQQQTQSHLGAGCYHNCFDHEVQLLPASDHSLLLSHLTPRICCFEPLLPFLLPFISLGCSHPPATSALLASYIVSQQQNYQSTGSSGHPEEVSQCDREVLHSTHGRHAQPALWLTWESGPSSVQLCVPCISVKFNVFLTSPP